MNEMHPAERFFSAGHPINSYLKVRFEGADARELTVSLRAPECFVGDRATGRLHSGLATLILDTVMGGAVMGHLERMQPIATAGLTAQHMRRPIAGEELACIARFEGIHEDMAHMSGRLVAKPGGEILSTATGTFMIGTRAKPLGVRL